MIEGGGQIAASALSSGVVQKVAFFYAPAILGKEALPGIGSLSVSSLSHAIRLDGVRRTSLGPDFLIEGYIKGRATGSISGVISRHDMVLMVMRLIAMRIESL